VTVSVTSRSAFRKCLDTDADCGSNEKTETHLMIPVEAHLILNHVPIVGLALGLVFFVSGLKQPATAAVLAGLRVFVAMGIVVLPVVGSGLMSATALANATWLDASAVSRHQLAGIVTLVVLVTLGALSGAMLWVSRKTSTLPRWGRTTILVLALVGFGTCLWTAYVGGRLRHSELRPTVVRNERWSADSNTDSLGEAIQREFPDTRSSRR
jgi:hypothetical protein